MGRFLKLLTFAFVFLSFITTSCGNNKKRLTILAGAGLKEPLTQIVNLYEKQNPNTDVSVIYGGSGTLLTYIKEGKGDVFIPGSAYYLRIAKEKGFIEPRSVRFVAYHTPVLVVRKSLAEKIHSIYDLAKVDLRIGLGDPQAAAIGRVTDKILHKAGIYEKVSKKVVVRTPTVNQLLVYLNTGQIDAAIVWKDLVKNNKDLVVISIPKGINEIKTIEVGIAKNTPYKDEALKFETFLISHREIFEKAGFTK